MDLPQCHLVFDGVPCGRKAINQTRLLCNAHYLQFRRGEPFRPARRATIRAGETPCNFEGCRNYSVSYGLCSAHRWQQKQGRTLQPLYGSQAERYSYTRRDDQGRKRCVRCREWKTEEFFGSSQRAVDGLRTECKSCRAEERRKASVQSHGTKISRTYGVPPEWYGATLAEQEGVCAICGGQDEHKRLAVDHDHKCCPSRLSCGECVRGLLCQRCNQVLGSVGESIDLLRKMVSYLNKWSSK